MTRLIETLRRYGRGEDGAFTVFGLYIFCVMLLIFGLAIDVANAWRNRTFLTSTADIAAHAGAVGIANGESQSQIETDIDHIIKTNLPPSMFGQIIDTTTDVSFGEYDVQQHGWSSFGGSDYNGVVVKLQRSRSYGNPVTTFIMRFMGVDSFDLSSRSAAVYDVNGDCDLTDGVYAEGKVTITTQAYVGSGYCIHSNDYVWLPNGNTFADNTMVTMQNFGKCADKCTDAVNPGIQARPAHMVFPDLRQFIIDTYDAFNAKGIPNTGVKNDWFTKVTDPNSPLYDPTDPEITLGDTSALVAALGLKSAPQLGDVIPMTYTDFTNFTSPLPSGLVYNVTCTKGGKFGQLDFDASHGQMDGGVLLTNCRILFDSGSKVVKSVIITEADTSNAAISANEGTTMGDPDQLCGAQDRSVIMALGPVSVPSDFTMSNLTLIVDGDVNVAAISNGNKTVNQVSYGFAVYSTEEVHFASKQTFMSCNNGSTFLTPEPKILRIVIPPAVASSGGFVTGTYTGSTEVNLGESMIQKISPGMGLTNGVVTVSN